MMHLEQARDWRSKKGFGIVSSIVAALVLAIAPWHLLAQMPDPLPKTSFQLAVPTPQGPIVGKWTYRSFISDPNLNTEPNKLLFGSGTLDLSQPAPDRLGGTIGGDGWQLTLSGEVRSGSPVTIRFQGRGVVNGEEWVYDYLGYVVPAWTNGIDQRPAIVGSIVRTVPHSGGTAKAGVVAQWIAVRQDANVPASTNRDGISRLDIARVEQQLCDLESKWALAVGTDDADKIGAFLANDFLFVGAGGILQSRQQHLDDFRQKRLRVQSVIVKECIVHAYGDFAVASTLTSVKGKLGERDISGDYRFMDTLRLAKGTWLAIARQQTKVATSPASPPQTKALAVVLRIRGDRSARMEAASALELRRQATMSLDSDLALPAPQRLSLARAATNLLKNAPVLNATDGTVTLEVKYGNNQKIGTDSVYLRSYNGNLIGPTLKVKAGQTLKINLVNHLPNEPAGGPHGTNGHHEWNTTNLHTHGLHVKPQADPSSPGPAAIESDNVLLELKPGDTQQYAFEVPADHPAGTFWYHAHKHGSTAAHVSSSMAGALIVTRDDSTHNLDSIPEVQAAMQTVGGIEREKIMVFQQIPYITTQQDPVGRIELANAGRMFGPGQWNQSNRYTTINGQQLPVIELTPGEIQRWRMIDTGFREGLSLQIVKDPGDTGPAPDHIDFHEIAVDGLALSAIRVTSTIDMFPGYRSDVLVQAPAVPGTYELIDALRTDHTLQGTAESLKFVAKVVVKNVPAVAMTMPTDDQVRAERLTSLPDPAPSTPVQEAYYGITNDGFVIGTADPGPLGAVSGSPYDPTVARNLDLGLTQRWRIGTRNDAAAVGDPPPPPPVGPAHPFHIHVNPFEIVSIKDENGVEQLAAGERLWRDTLSMPPGWTIEFLTKYADFPGSFVQHCHILDHEDRGMMQQITISANGNPTTRTTPRNRVFASLADLPASPEVLFFVKGSACPHCVSQLSSMASTLGRRNARVAVVSASSASDLERFPAMPFALVADPTLQAFKKYGAFDGAAKHATIVRDRTGKEVLRKVGDEPFFDSRAVLAAVTQTNPSFVIAVRGTDDPKDDYITWSTAECTIRMVNGDRASGPVSVTLTNDDPTSNPTAGELRFAQTLAPASTATLTSLMLQLDPNGTPVSFFIAGVKPSTLTPASLLNGGRDTKIVIHQGNETGPRLGDHAVMVRVRKALRDPTDPRPKANDLELTETLKAIRDLHQVDNRLEWYVRLHRLATHHAGSAAWPDQAHRGPAFIAWHRAFLLQFERELQVRYPHVALPYWVQGTQEQFFVNDRLGTSPSSGDIVDFSPNSPLYGWSLSLPMDPEGNGVPMGVLRRRPVDHNDPTAPQAATGAPYLQWTDLLPVSGIENFAIFRSIESNPHNNGHQTVGPDLIWMQNCRESNADPVFYVFHCNHDYLWAKWQYTFNRFATDGSDPAHYSPGDAFTDANADKTIALGHHLKDTMWPWDGTTGQVVAGQPYSNRPNVNGFGPFPQSPVPLLWPPAVAQPRPADVIDYAGYLTRANDLGFCYDDVPFGAQQAQARPIPLVVSTKLRESERLSRAVITDRGINVDARLLALRALSDAKSSLSPESVKTLSTIVNDASEPADVRIEALRKWSTQAPADALHSSLSMIRDGRAPLNVRLAALREAASQIHFPEIPPEEAHRIFDGLRQLIRAGVPAPLQAAAARHLAPVGDPAAKSLVIASLPPLGSTALSWQEAVALLRFYPEEKERLRGFASSANDSISVAAIRALYNDADSVETRKHLALDDQRSLMSRVAAIQSLIHDDAKDLTEFLTAIAADPSDEMKLRVEALAAASVRLRKNLNAYSDVDRRKWQSRLESIRCTDTSELGRLRQESIQTLSKKP
jgi:FtsP/CotA-like multicopper oxidase with cupredoxin domain/peroxiredoxin